MKFIVPIICLLILAISCDNILADKHLNEKTITSKDITVRWYTVSDITFVHDFVDVERNGKTIKVFKASTRQIHDIFIHADTITIQTVNWLRLPSYYPVTSKAFGYNIKFDSTITVCQYVKKHEPENAENVCDEETTDTSITVN